MKVLVIGDSCVDYYIYGRCDRLSPEAPAPIFVTNGYRPIHSLGMASNVYNNLKALGVDCTIVTNIAKPSKTRYIDTTSNYQIMRIDENDEITPITSEILNMIKLNEYDAIVISDYNKGYLTYEDIMYFAENHPLVFLDSKKPLEHWCDDIMFIKVNEKEFYGSERYLTEDFPNHLIVTLGSEGALYHNEKKYIKPKKRVEVRDVSGAGDTFFAGFVADYLKNNDICKAIEFANKCASWVVTQRGVVSVNLKQIENDNS